MEVDFYHYVGRNRHRIGKVAFFALPLVDRNDFSCTPEHLITFDEAKWIAGELDKSATTGRMRYYTLAGPNRSQDAIALRPPESSCRGIGRASRGNRYTGLKKLGNKDSNLD